MGNLLFNEMVNILNENGEVHGLTVISDNEKVGKKIVKGNGDFIGKSDFEFWDSIIKDIELNKGTYIKKVNDEEILVEHIVKKPQLVICGGGHIALPLSKIGKMLEFDVTVIDNREEFANKERFQGIDKVICGEFDEVINEMSTNNNTYFVIVTRGHKDDKRCLENIIRKPHKYIGMIGSKAKVISVFNRMMEDGYKKEELENVHTPIGLDIGAQTPEEIAISILAEIIEVKNKNIVSNIEDKIINEINNGKDDMVLATIVEKRGSTPRGIGAKMLVLKDGSFIGTVGGGSVENAVHEKSKELLSIKKSHIEKYDLSNSKASKLGMACGGTIKVLFEYININE